MRRFPSYPKRPHKTGQARIVVGKKDIYLGVHGSPDSWSAYNRLLTEWTAGAAASELRPHQVISVVELVARWQRHAQVYYAGSTELRDFGDTLKPLVRLYGDTDAHAFGPRQMKALREAMATGSWRTADEVARFVRRGQAVGWSRRLVNQRVNRIKRVWKWAVSEEIVPGDAYQRLQAVESFRAGKSKARESPPVQPVAASVVAATLPYLPPVPRVMVEVQLLTGMRPGELCRLTPGQIDRAPVIDGQPVPGVWIYRPARHKTQQHGHGRAVVIGPRAQALLLPYLDRPADAVCFSPQESERQRLGRDPWRPCLTFYRVRAYSEAVRQGCRKAKVEHWHPHRLRHSAETVIQRHSGLDAARACLGHSNAQMTIRYGEQDIETAAQVMRDVG